MITFEFLRVPKSFVVLCICVGIIAWVGFSGRWISPRVALPTMAELQEEAEIRQAKVGEAAPDFTLTDLSGEAQSLSAYQGRPVILYFWASWCPYCTDEMPSLNDFRDAYQEEGLEVLAINILESAEHVRKAVEEMKLTYPVLLDESGRVTRSYLVRATPTYILIDSDGVYRDLVVGSPRKGVLEGKIAPLLPSNN